MTTAVTLNVSGLTPSLLGAGLDFDVVLTAIPRENPLKFSGAINGQVNLDIDALLSDEAGTFQITPEASMDIAGLTPAALSTGLDFDIELTAVQPENPIKFVGGFGGQVNLDVPSLLSDESGTLEIIEQAQMNINGLTPDVLGTGLEFDVEFAPAQPQNPIPLTGEINGQVNIDASALTESPEAGTMQIIPVAEVEVEGLTPEALGSGLSWDALRQTEGYYSATARETGDPAERIILSAWNPNEDPAPFDAPVTRPNEPGQPVAGTIPMLEENYLGSEELLFTVVATGTPEGPDDETLVVRGSFQPMSAGDAAAAADALQGARGAWLYTSATLNTVTDGQADRIERPDGTYEVYGLESWQNGIISHNKYMMRSLAPMGDA